MGSVNHRSSRSLPSPPHNPAFTRAHQITALALVAVTFILTRAFDRLSCSSPSLSLSPPSPPPPLFDHRSGALRWPDRGFGAAVSLKIYVYSEEEIDGLALLLRGREGKISADACVKGQWGTQVLSQMPYFRLSGGRNHVFVFPSGAGAHLFRSWATFLNRSIILTPEGDRTDKRDISSFNTWKDIIVPGNVDDGMTTFYGSTVVSPIPLSKRKYLANFLGRAQGKVGRLQLVELSKQYPDKLEAPELMLTGPNKLGRIEYFNHLRNAKFCLAPRGESSWTLRFYESYFVECVPVILSDQVELPFQNVIDYTQISIKWPATQIGAQLLEYLESIPHEVIEGMIP